MASDEKAILIPKTNEFFAENSPLLDKMAMNAQHEQVWVQGDPSGQPPKPQDFRVFASLNSLS